MISGRMDLLDSFPGTHPEDKSLVKSIKSSPPRIGITNLHSSRTCQQWLRVLIESNVEAEEDLRSTMEIIRFAEASLSDVSL